MSVSVAIDAYNPDMVSLRVRDTGIGIDEDGLSRLFQPFTQVDGSTSRRHAGTGLGLSICKRLVDLMGGDIGVKSQIGKGSEFYFRLRLPTALESTSTSANKLRRLSGMPADRGGNPQDDLQVLLAEDDPINRKVALSQLRKLGYSVDIATNGEEALQAASHREYDIILMDVQMPDIDGIEAMQRIRTAKGNDCPPIIAMTANAMAGDRQRLLKLGMDDYMSKPYTSAELQDMVVRWCPDDM